MMGYRIFTLLFSVATIAAWMPAADAAKVLKVNGKKVMLDLEGDAAKSGDIFIVYDPKGKRIGTVKIRAVKGGKAVGLLDKGKAKGGWSAKASDRTQKVASERSSGASRSKSAKSAAAPSGQSYWGIVGGMAMNSISVKIDNTGDNINETSVSLTGTAFSAKGLYDYNLFPGVWFRSLVGLEGLNASGPTQVGCQNKACAANIYYLSADLWGRYVFGGGDFRPWVGAAFSLMFPVSKKATALEESSITNTSAMTAGIGIDWFTSPTLAIPIQVEYSMLPKSETVEATAINARIGVFMPF